MFTSLLNNTFIISRRLRSADGQGGHEIGYVNIGVAAGRIRPATSAEIERAAQEQRQITHVLYVEPGTDIARGDMATTTGLQVDVVGLRNPSWAAHHLEMDCVEIQREAKADTGS